MLNAGVGSDLTFDDLRELELRAHRARSTVLTATTVAASGHPGGSFSSMEIYTLLYGTARLRPSEPRWVERDRIVISHGHTSPGAYAALAYAGFFSPSEVEAHFRQAGSVFEGHVERSVPGIEWSTGNLGQGLSAGVGLALGARMTGGGWHTFVAMSDGEQMKGQVAEARRLAIKEGLAGLTVLIDYNHIQISGRTDEIMPVDLAAGWKADGWRVIECDGHDIPKLHEALKDAVEDARPTVILAHTVIGKGVSFIEDLPDYHGKALSRDEYVRAMDELGSGTDGLGAAVVRRSMPCPVAPVPHETPLARVDPGTPREYEVGKSVDNRSAWGSALVDIEAGNGDVPIAVFDCDLAGSVKTDGFAHARPSGFVQCGVGEHNAATASGALSTVPGVVTFWSDFGVFGIDEAYNQQRLNDLNGAALKLVVTHCGLDVGEDGKTHQCLDYVGAFRGFFGWRVIVPADANQTDRAVRAAVGTPGCVCIAMGRSKLPVIADAQSRPLFGGDYAFRFGEVVWAREGVDACILTMGTVAGEAVAAADALREEHGIAVAVGIIATPLEIDAEALERATSFPLVLTTEDHHVETGLGASVAEWVSINGRTTRLERIGVRTFQSSGASADLLRHVGLDSKGIEEAVRRALGVL